MTSPSHSLLAASRSESWPSGRRGGRRVHRSDLQKLEKAQKTPLSILFITRAYRQDAGGMERLSYELVNELSSDQNINATIIAHQGPRTTSPFFILTSLPKALRSARQADIVHLGDPMLSFIGWLIKLMYRKPVAIMVHGLDISFPNSLYQLYLKLFFHHFDLYLPISNHVQKILSQRPIKATIEVITPGLHDHFHDSTITRQDLEQLLHSADYELRQHDKTLLTSGRLVERKGQRWFIEHVLPSLPDNYHYLVAGTGPEHDQIEKTLATTSSAVARRVHLLGRVSEEQLKILYNAVDAFVQPNVKVDHDIEGFGLVLLEAALCKRPVYAANIDGIPSAIHDQQNGYLIPSGDASAWQQALQQIPTTTASTRQYSLDNFNWPNQATKYKKAFEDLLRHNHQTS